MQNKECNDIEEMTAIKGKYEERDRKTSIKRIKVATDKDKQWRKLI